MMNRFEEFNVAYQKLVGCGVAKKICDKELFLHYIDAETNYPALKVQWEEENVYHYFSGLDRNGGCD